MQQDDLALFERILRKLLSAEKNTPVLEPLPAAEIFQSLDLSLGDKASSPERFSEALEQLVLHTPRTATRSFFNQLFGGRHSKATLGDLLAVILNNSMYTYKVAGPMVGVEKEVLRRSAALLGYPETADGTIAPGGSMTNFMALLMARDAYNRKIPQEGLRSDKMLLYTSEDCHYSIAKNAAFAGLGRKAVRYVPTDPQGRMQPDALRSILQADLAQGYEPFMINATAGTTVMGAFDPLPELADIAEEFQLWLHVDGAYCGSVIFSERYRSLVKGAERADSFSYNAHKMLAVPLSCSLILVREPQFLQHSFSKEADYLYQTDDDDYNLGKTSLQCGRRNDALKFWTLWKAIGREGLGALVDRQFALAERARAYVEQHPDYELYSYPDSIGVCFNYQDWPAEELCTALYEKGELMVGYGQFADQRFVRLVTVNSLLEEEDIDRFFADLEAFAEANEALSVHR